MLEWKINQRMPDTKLIYLEEVERIKPKIRRAKFKCDCGNVVYKNICDVRSLNTKSCGCLRKELLSIKNYKHGHSIIKSGVYRTWQAMHQRVRIHPNYKKISICKRWFNFTNFYEDMGDRPKKHSIERINNNGNYEPSNCKWATQLEQGQNTSNTKLITIGEETHSISAWCRIKGISYQRVKQRRTRQNMTLIQAITTPLDISKQNRKN